jgi:hypothetical protein
MAFDPWPQVGKLSDIDRRTKWMVFFGNFRQFSAKLKYPVGAIFDNLPEPGDSRSASEKKIPSRLCERLPLIAANCGMCDEKRKNCSSWKSEMPPTSARIVMLCLGISFALQCPGAPGCLSASVPSCLQLSTSFSLFQLRPPSRSPRTAPLRPQASSPPKAGPRRESSQPAAFRPFLPEFPRSNITHPPRSMAHSRITDSKDRGPPPCRDRYVPSRYNVP